MLTVHHLGVSQSERIVWLCEELGLDYEFRRYDRRADNRMAPDPSDFWILKHTWNNLDQAEILDGVVGPVLEAWYREHPETRRTAAADVGIEALIGEINRIRDLLTGDRPLSDIQLFSQLKALNEVKAALQAMGTEPARQAVGRVDQLLGHVFQSGKFAQ